MSPVAVMPPVTASGCRAVMPLIALFSVVVEKSDATVSQDVTFAWVMVSRSERFVWLWSDDPPDPLPLPELFSRAVTRPESDVSDDSAVDRRLFRSHPRAADRIQPAFVLSYAGHAPLTGSRRS